MHAFKQVRKLYGGIGQFLDLTRDKEIEYSTPLSSPFLNPNPLKNVTPLFENLAPLSLPLSPEYALIHKSGKIFHPLISDTNAINRTIIMV